MDQTIFMLTTDIQKENMVRDSIQHMDYRLYKVNKSELMSKIYRLNPKVILIDIDSYEIQTFQMIQTALSIEYIPVIYIYSQEITEEKKVELLDDLKVPITVASSVLPYLIMQAISFKSSYNQMKESYDAIDLMNGEIKRLMDQYVLENTTNKMKDRNRDLWIFESSTSYDRNEIQMLKKMLELIFSNNAFLSNKPEHVWVIYGEDKLRKAVLFYLPQNENIIEKVVLPIFDEDEFGFDIYGPNGFYRNFDQDEVSDIASDSKEIFPVIMGQHNPAIHNFSGYAVGDVIFIGINYSSNVTNYEVGIMKTLAINLDLLNNIELQMDEVNQAFIYTMEALARAAEVNDDMTGEHIKRVNIFSKLLAQELGLPKRFIEEIFQSAQMHDVGKIYVDHAILTKPGKLTDKEYEIMKLHTVYGEKIIGDSKYLQMAAEIAKNHHERYDGTGYPDGKKGEEIPLSARIVFLADIYDALRSQRSYKPGFSHETAYEIITKGDGRVEPKHFDPEVLNAFKKIHLDFMKVYGIWNN